MEMIKFSTLFRCLHCLLAAILLQTACSTDDAEPQQQQELVVEGWVAEGQFPVVFVSTTIPIQQRTTSLDSLELFIAQWARVQVDDGQDTVVLTGMRDSRYFPPYLFTTNRMRGKAGRTYHLTIDWHGQHAEAWTAIPPTVEVDSLWAQPSEGSDTLRDVCLRFHDNPDTRDHYLVFSRRTGEPQNPQLCVFGLVDDKVLAQPQDHTAAQTEVTIHVRRGGVLAESNYSSFYARGDTVSVTLAHVDSITYTFWRAFEDNRQLSTAPFATAITPLTTNIHGGHGIWYGCGSAAQWLIID